MDKKDALVIEPGDEILIRYRVLANKEVVDTSQEPIVLRVGEGKFMPIVENALVGHKTGERVIVLVSPEEHYGKYDPKKIQVVPSEKIPEGTNPGSIVKIQDEYGVVHPAILKKVEEGLAVVDFNHPLAGKTLRFEVDILGIKKKDSSSEDQEEARGEQ
ncbi:peptidylprolyl isomerase FKBP-type [Thermodesulfatator indicus DSM 15286]|uniref:Peptidyl-prolyl cis-trans isomerase n=1 Tax=Thermodesulfatator indicus (strain DSM 15286 / JCM 11887 / CIR29812) TaxID=667014 RepID=F8A9E3_THEID|nr:FKBP-type peptidyl-prolyl cis-trans isomerase [Thermodesulfatator indicus]AEH44084.1 peptidylprolyl isomerase FKBP-type [Thermodesulfatator indicus DSM 15286]